VVADVTDEARFRAAEAQLWESFGVAPHEERLALDRLGISVRVQTVGAGPPVLFVHGAHNAGASWASLVPLLPDHRCLLLDRPGCGLSEPLPSCLADLDELARYADALVVDVLDALAIERAAVAATSYGGYFAVRAAHAQPDRVARVLLFGWSLGASRLPASLRLASLPEVGRLMTAVPQNERSVRALLRRIGLRGALDSGRFTAAMLDWYVSLLRDTGTLGNELRAVPRFPLLRMDDRMLLSADLLGEVRTPVHCLWGEDDPFGGIAAARTFVGLLPDARLELLPGAGHAVWVDDPERAAVTARSFLAG
jgi:pimeloyl-ACP methyl ester carboxylesterase